MRKEERTKYIYILIEFPNCKSNTETKPQLNIRKENRRKRQVAVVD